MKMISFSGTFILPACLLLLVTSCKKEISKENVQEGLSERAASVAAAAETDPLKSIRQATSRYHSTTQAIKDGYLPDNHCVSVPGLGGMGFHWANPSLVDPVFDPLQPEAVLYAPGPGGKLRLVAVEYIVINAGQPRPSLDGHLFDIGGAPVPVAHWTLHVWLYEENPSGMFVPFNPNIICP